MKLDLLRYFKGFVRNYGSLLLGPEDSLSTFTHREVEFWMKLGEMMGFLTRQEKGRKIKGHTRKTDLLWFDDDLEAPILQLESENYSPMDCIKNRLDNTIPYLILLSNAGGAKLNKGIRKAAQKLVDKSLDIKEMLIVTYEEEDDVRRIPMTGSRLQRNRKPDEIKAHLTHTGSGFYYGVLTKEEEENWYCEFCEEPFSTLRAAELHEESCPMKGSRNES